MKERMKKWWCAESRTFSRLCATEKGETFTHGEVVLANLGVIGLLLLCAFAEWMGREGGAPW